MAPIQDIATSLIGQQLGSYRVARLLGEGGMGFVLLGEHVSLKRKAAIKLLRPELAQRAEVVQRFFNEALAANQIKHPGIVDIYDYAQSDAGAYLVMEYLDGETLADVIDREDQLPLESVVLLITRIASPLAAAHDEQIVHRDLKPDNIFVLPDPDHPGDVRVKLLDFGIAKLKEVEQPSMRTATGMVLGTPFYMSPEQCHGAREVDHRSDIYALGVIAYQLISGELPIIASGFGELLLKHQTEAPRPLDVKALGIPEAVEAQLLRAMAKDPEARFTSATEFAQALTLAAGVRTPNITLPPQPVHQAAQLVQAETAVTLPRTVMSSPGMPVPSAQGGAAAPAAAPQQLAPPVGADSTLPPNATPTPAAAIAPALAPTAAQIPPGATGPLPQQSRSGPSKTAILAIVGGLLTVGVIVAAVIVIAGSDGGDDAPTKPGSGATAAKPGSAAAGSAAAAKKPTPRKTSPDDAPMATIPAGPFRYGQAKREIVLSAFEIDRHEVTVAQYKRCVAAGGCDGRKVDGVELPGQVAFRKSPRCNAGHGDRASHPQNCVTWEQAAQYCRWAKKRLPTEAEWEKAARGTDGREHPWKSGAVDCGRAVFRDAKKGEGCGAKGSAAVGSRSPAGDSPYGVRDLVGNVAEWVADRYDAKARSTAATRDPKGPPAGKRRTVRGGSFTNSESELSAVSRIGLPPAYRLEDVGFRCAR
jgi:formylglycine-generating enzyme required for sulfatase activity/tRNA A-37 threonylcarbamoyl transferase component Bud32